MPKVPAAPRFRGTLLAVDYQRSIRDVESVHRAIHRLVRRLEERDAPFEQLLAELPEVVAEYGYSGRVVDRTDERMTFSVTKL